MRIRYLCVLLALIITGCDKSTLQTENENRMQKSQNEGAPTGQSQHVLVEEVLVRNIREVPIARRYAVITQKADDLWNLLDGLPSDDKEYTILVAARFQRELEAELKGLEIPQKTIDLGPRHVSKDGTRYYMATRETASAAVKEERSRSEIAAYRKQLEDFLARYPNRLDSQSMKESFETLSPEAKARVMEQIVELLGNRPQWATK